MTDDQVVSRRRLALRTGRNGVAKALPGVAVALAVGGACLVVGRFQPMLSPLLIAILAGIAWRNTLGVPTILNAGIAFSAKRLLRVGIVLLGLQIALSEVLSLGVGTIIVVVLVVAIGMAGTYGVGRALGLSATQSLLIASGFSICGAAAVAAAGGVLKAKQEEVATALALVVLFGTLMIPVIPLLSHLWWLDPHVAGLWAGASVHEVAQVVAIGGILGGGALAVAVLVKLCRVLMLAPVMAALSWHQRRLGTGGPQPALVPFFVVAFVIAVLVRSTGVLPGPVLDVTSAAQTVLLAAAMFALGCGVRFDLLRRVGLKPFALGLGSTVLVAVTGLVGTLAVQA